MGSIFESYRDSLLLGVHVSELMNNNLITAETYLNSYPTSWPINSSEKKIIKCLDQFISVITLSFKSLFFSLLKIVA